MPSYVPIFSAFQHIVELAIANLSDTSIDRNNSMPTPWNLALSIHNLLVRLLNSLVDLHSYNHIPR